MAAKRKPDALQELADTNHMSTTPDQITADPTPETTDELAVASGLALRRFPEKGQIISREPEEWCFARDLLDCSTIEEAHALAKRVLKERSDFWKTC